MCSNARGPQVGRSTPISTTSSSASSPPTMRTSPICGTHEKTVALLRFGSRTVAVGSPVCCHSMNRPALAQATIGAILRVIQLTLLTRGGSGRDRREHLRQSQQIRLQLAQVGRRLPGYGAGYHLSRRADQELDLELRLPLAPASAVLGGEQLHHPRSLFNVMAAHAPIGSQ